MENKKEIKPKDLPNLIANENPIIIDLRGRGYFLIDHVKDSINIENYKKVELIAKENKEKKILLYCHHGITAANFVNELLKSNIDNVYYINGSFTDIIRSGVEIIYHK